jgi:membrane-bound ClpP family serine protease
MKKRSLTLNQEFELMKIVIDKFLLFAVFVLSLGFYRLITGIGSSGFNLTIIISGVILLLVFIVLLMKEYDYIKI